MIATAWTNGGTGYGVKIAPADRDQFFRREWGDVLLELDGESLAISCNIDKDSFWTPACRELICIGIGQWLKKTGLAPWKENCPPKLTLTPLSGNRFRLTRDGIATHTIGQKMRLLEILNASYKGAVSNTAPDDPSTDVWVEELAKNFLRCFSNAPDVRVFSKGNHENRDLFPKNEHLFDVHVCEVSYAGIRRDSYLKQAIWQIESEVPTDGTVEKMMLEDFGKLLMGNAPNKLMIGPSVAWEGHLLKVLCEAAHHCSGTLWLALIPKRFDWGTTAPEAAVRLWGFRDGNWQVATDGGPEVGS